MRILVLSDTHIPRRAQDLPREIWEMAEKVDLIVHAGDFTTGDVLTELKGVNPNLQAVWGNMDEPDLVHMLPEKLVFDAMSKRIGVTHGSGSPWRIEKRVLEKFRNEKVDVIIFGHSHQAILKEEEGILLFNPGSPTDRIFSKKLTFGLLEISEEGIEAKILPLKE